jgi:hypothetical protein
VYVCQQLTNCHSETKFGVHNWMFQGRGGQWELHSRVRSVHQFQGKFKQIHKISFFFLGTSCSFQTQLFLITNRKIHKGFIFVQLFHMFYNIYFLFGSIIAERALKLCRFATLIPAVSPQWAVSKVNFPTVVALEDSFLGCCWVHIIWPATFCK